MLLEVLNTSLTYRVIEEVDLDNWGWGGCRPRNIGSSPPPRHLVRWGGAQLIMSFRKIGPCLLGKHVCGVPIGPVMVMLAPVSLLMLAMGSRSAPKGCCQIAAGG